MSKTGNKHPRRLQVYSLDPAADVRLDVAMISRCVLNIEWEDVEPGPIGDYVEVIDIDPASGCGYEPVDLNEFLASDGLSPSTGNPQFHQQMVYAVVMHTIKNFERVLGRRVVWAERSRDENGDFLTRFEDRYVPRLRIYPHALRQQNAFYSPSKKSLLFGYFNAPTDDPREELPGGLVFTCLSHDIAAHETTHAILDGIHPRLLDASNSDMLAFHEAFADIVAIFQHFSLPGLLLDQVQKTRGELDRNNLLVELASQFARSTGRGNALRNALGSFDENGRRAPPDPSDINRTTEPHERGAILVAAVFDAFLRIYAGQVADLRRIASQGTGILAEGDIHSDLAQRLAKEAVKAAGRVLTICIRAIDYLPPVDITFGDYLRALITADADLVPDDPHRYRLAFIESFRERGIYPIDIQTLAEDSLKWNSPSEAEVDAMRDFLPPLSILRTMAFAYDASEQFVDRVVESQDKILAHLNSGGFNAAAAEFIKAAWETKELPKIQQDQESPREQKFLNRFLLDKVFCIVMHRWIMEKAKQFIGIKSKAARDAAINLGWSLGLDIDELNENGRLEVHSIRPTVRVRPDGRTKTELLIVLTQRIRESLLDENGEQLDDAHGDPLEFKYRGGTTLIIDPEQGRVEYAICKNVGSERRKKRQAAFLRGQVKIDGQSAVARFGLTRQAAAARLHMEPLAIIHRSEEEGGLY